MVLFHMRVKTLKNTLRPNNEQHSDFQIIGFVHLVLNALILYSHDSNVLLFIERKDTDSFKGKSTVFISRTPNYACQVSIC